MPTTESMMRMQDMRNYFRQKYAGKVADPNEVRKDMQTKFPWISNNRWYPIRQQLLEINQQHQGRAIEPQAVIAVKEQPQETAEEQGIVVHELEIPADLPETAKDALNKLLEINNSITQDIALKDVEIASLRSTNAALQARARLLKKVHCEVVEAL